MGSGPVKGFNNEAVQQIITKKHDHDQNKIAKEDAETATFAAGCFWGVQLAFQRVPGVASTMVGYTAGSKQHPSYNDVCSGQTGNSGSINKENFIKSIVSQVIQRQFRCCSTLQLSVTRNYSLFSLIGWIQPPSTGEKNWHW